MPDSPLLPLVTVTSTTPVPAGAVAVISVADVSETLVAGVAPNATVLVGVNPVPGDGHHVAADVRP